MTIIYIQGQDHLSELLHDAANNHLIPLHHQIVVELGST